MPQQVERTVPIEHAWRALPSSLAIIDIVAAVYTPTVFTPQSSSEHRRTARCARVTKACRSRRHSRSCRRRAWPLAVQCPLGAFTMGSTAGSSCSRRRENGRLYVCGFLRRRGAHGSRPGKRWQLLWDDGRRGCELQRHLFPPHAVGHQNCVVRVRRYNGCGDASWRRRSSFRRSSEACAPWTSTPDAACHRGADPPGTAGRGPPSDRGLPGE